MAGGRRISILKVDIEGAEVELFQGDLEWLTHVGAIAIEFHKNARAHCSFDEIMREYRFSIVADTSHTVIALKGARE